MSAVDGQETTLHYRDDLTGIHRVVVGPRDTNVYVIRCMQTGEAVLIDPADEPQQLVELSRSLGVRRVLVTHGHWDHIQAVPAMRNAGYPVGVTAADADMIRSYDFVLDDDEVLSVGSLRLRTIATPGHTPGSICFGLEESPVVFSGDTLFSDGPGVIRFPLGDFPTLIHSIEDRLLRPLPAETIVMPGHGGDTTISTASSHLQEWIDRGW